MVKSETLNTHNFHDRLWRSLCRSDRGKRKRRENKNIEHNFKIKLNNGKNATSCKHGILMIVHHVIKVVKRFGTIWSSKLGDSIDKSLMKLSSPSETRLWVSGEDESGVPLNSTHLPIM